MASELTAVIGEPLSHQALGKKLQSSKEFFRSLAQDAINQSKAMNISSSIDLPGVGAILIADSSNVALNNSLAEVLPGTGGCGPKASAKINAVFDLSSQQVQYLDIAEGSASEHSFKADHMNIAKKSDLLIRDLGYFDMEDLEALDENGVYYLSRVPLSVAKFTDATGSPFDLWHKLTKHRGYNFEADLGVGAEAIPSRVVALRLPKNKWQDKVAALKKEKGLPLTSIEKTKAKWTLMVTNLPENYTCEQIGKIYALRWQIELLFKAWKSQLGLATLKQATCKSVVLALLWAKLTGAIVLSSVRKIVETFTKEEVGLIRWHRRISVHFHSLRTLIRSQSWLAIAQLIRDAIIPRCKSEKSRRKSSLSKVKMSMGLGESP